MSAGGLSSKTGSNSAYSSTKREFTSWQLPQAMSTQPSDAFAVCVSDCILVLLCISGYHAERVVWHRQTAARQVYDACAQVCACSF